LGVLAGENIPRARLKNEVATSIPYSLKVS
jgi:hypothetical protein